ncbi:MAG: DUF1846 domain-containing protein [Clostridiales bacterium]|nr:DUF1846 domain-containing protein [Clostridiales bacterium]
MYKLGFDNDKYLKMQSGKIRERISEFGGKLYLEFGGKLFDDFHASRVLPSFQPDSKLQMLLHLKEEAEIVIVVSAQDIEKCKLRSDLGITYDVDAQRLINEFREKGLMVGSVVLTKYASHPRVLQFEEKLGNLGVPVYRHYFIEGYPSNISHIVSDDGYGKNDYIKTERRLVVITAPGPGSGKMAVCLSQLYHENKRGVKAGYAKFETFPIWNLPLSHPVNMAYEAATADLNDINMIDPWHLEAYGKTAVNYNRDVEIFPVLKATFERIYGECPYKSPTDMGVNMAGSCIFDDNAVSQASYQEIIRRFFNASADAAKGASNMDEIFKLELLMNQAGISAENRKCTVAARKTAAESGEPAAAAELNDGTVITGKNSKLLGCASAMLLNALKHLAGIDDKVLLIVPKVIIPIQELKTNHLGNRNPRLHTDEVLIALAVSAASDDNAAAALAQLCKLNNCEMHSSVLLSDVDAGVLRKLGIRLTCDPVK